MSKILTILFILTSATHAAQSQLNYELNLPAGYDGEEAVFVVPGQRPGVGVEYFRILSGEYGDIGRIDVQAGLTADPNGRYESPYVLTPFAGNDELSVPAVQFELHNAYAHFKLNRGRSDVWTGHRDVAYGLEPTLDTHAAMLQTFAMDAVGFKKDWGLGAVGRFEKWDYRAAATLGSGMAVAGHGNRMVAARLGILDPDVSGFGFGVSGLYGRVLPTMDLAVMSDEPDARTLGGIDFTLLWGRFGIRADSAIGRVADAPAGGVWARVSASIPSWRWLEAAAQGSTFYDDIGEKSRIVRAGAEVTAKYNAALTPGVAYLYSDDRGAESREVFVHIYYYYPTLTRWLPSRDD
jgi:hypothetical protein